MVNTNDRRKAVRLDLLVKQNSGRRSMLTGIQIIAEGRGVHCDCHVNE